MLQIRSAHWDRQTVMSKVIAFLLVSSRLIIIIYMFILYHLYNPCNVSVEFFFVRLFVCFFLVWTVQFFSKWLDLILKTQKYRITIKQINVNLEFISGSYLHSSNCWYYIHKKRGRSKFLNLGPTPVAFCAIKICSKQKTKIVFRFSFR